jgi:hypothetical protein
MPGPPYTILINGVDVSDDDVEIHVGRTSGSAKRTMQCAWNKVNSLAAFLRGGSLVIGGITVFTPAQALSPDFPYLFIDTIDILGLGAKTVDQYGRIAYERAQLIANYTNLGLLEGTETGSINLDFGKEIISLPGDGLKFNGSSLPVPFNVPITIPMVCITQTRTNLAVLPTSRFLLAAGSPMDNSGLYGTGSETLLYDGGRALRTFTTAGATNWTIEVRTQYKPTKWGYFVDPSDGTFKKILRKDGSPLYASSSLGLLFL